MSVTDPKAEAATLRDLDAKDAGFSRELGVLDSTMIVAGSMIGSGIFIVSADISRQTGSAAGLLGTWLLTGLLTVFAALAYGELAAMMPHAGGQYVYLKEAYSPLWGFLYGWALFFVVQTGTIAAVAVGFARFLGILTPAVSPTSWIVRPIDVSSGYAISLSTQQLVGIVMVLFLTVLNTYGIRTAKLVQNVFTSAKTLALALLILVGIFVGWNQFAVGANFGSFFTPRNPTLIRPELSFLPTVSAGAGLLGILIAIGVSQVGSLFSSDAWNNITFAAGEVKDPKRTLPRALLAGTLLVTALYCLANVAYLVTLPLEKIQNAPDDRVGTATLGAIFGPPGARIMAIAILISTFGCNNGLILAGARVYYAMAKDGLFFKAAGKLNLHKVPAVGLVLQGIWASFLILPRTRLRDGAGNLQLDAAGQPSYGNLYGNLLDYVVFSVLIFYVLTIAAVFVLRRKRPLADRPYRTWGYPVLPALYCIGATTILVILILYRTSTTWPGLLLVLTGLPVYALWSRSARASGSLR